MEILTEAAGQTQKFSREFAGRLKGGEIVALEGELGSGKTTFVQGLAKGLGIKERIISPTFILMREHPIKGGKTLYHIDLYRVEENVEKEFRNLGIEDIWAKSNNIVVVEWAEKVRNLLPESAIWIKFENLGEDRRKIEAIY